MFPYVVNSMETQWRIQGKDPGGPPPLIFRPNWGSKGRKLFRETGPPPYLRVWMTAPHLISRSGSGMAQGNIALLYMSFMFPPCGNMLISVMFPDRKRTIKFPSHFCYYISVFSSVKSFHGLAPNSSYNLRGKDSLSIPRVQSTKYGLYSFRYSASKYWNMLPEVLRTADHYTCF